jgi:hypothetical protein
VLITPSAAEYAWRQLFSRIGSNTEPREWNDVRAAVRLVYGASAFRSNNDKPTIIVAKTADGSVDRLLVPSGRTADWLDPEDVCPRSCGRVPAEKLPVFLWGEGEPRTRFASLVDERTLLVHVDLIASTMFCLTRYEERDPVACDVHGRFSGATSVAAREGFLDRPVIDEYAFALKRWIDAIAPEPEFTLIPRQFSVHVSHDVDLLTRTTNPILTLRRAAGALVRREGRREVASRLNDAFWHTVDARQAPYVKGVFRLAQMSRSAGLTSAFYFMMEEEEFGCGYDPHKTPIAREVIEAVRREGCEIGIHGTYRTVTDSEALKREKSKLAQLIGREPLGGRQHLLRFRVPDTWRCWRDAGLKYDATLGFADMEGFRAGTCHPYQPFDLTADREIDIWELPLVVMDATLKNYRRMSPAAAEARIMELATRCAAVHGVFSILWHNSSLVGTWHDWADMYARILSRLGSMARAEADAEGVIASAAFPWELPSASEPGLS